MSKKILIFINNFENGGAEKILLNISNYLYQEKYEIKVMCINNRGHLKKILNKNIQTISLDKPRLVFSLFGINKVINSYKPDFIITSLPHLNLAILILKKIFFFKTKVIIREANLIDKIYQENKFKNFIFIILKRIFYRYAYRLVAITESVKDNLINYQKVSNKNLVTIYNPVFIKNNSNNISFEKNYEWIKNYKHPILISVGRLVKQKNFESIQQDYHQCLSRHHFPTESMTDLQN